MRKYWIVFCVIAVLIGLLSGVELRNALVQGIATLDIEAMITKGSVFRVYLNNNYAQPQAATIRPGEWTHYRIEVPSHITALRFDPSDVAGAQIYIRAITLGAPGKVSRSIDVSHLRTWIGPHISATVDDATHALLLTTDAPGGYLMGSEEVSLPNHFAPLTEQLRLDGATMLITLLISGGLALLAGVRRTNTSVAVLAVVAIGAAFVSVPKAASYLLGSVHGAAIPVNHAVGGGAFAGLSLSAEYFSANASIALSLAIALVSGLIWSRLRTGKLLPGVCSVRSSQPVNLWIFGIFSALLAAFLFPPSAAVLKQSWADRILADSDSQTVFSWQYLVYHGALPWRDFWFPYGGFADRLAPVYPYYFYELANQLLLMGVLIWTALKIWSNRWGLIAGICVIYLVLGMAQVFSLLASERYLLSMSVVLLSAVAAREATGKYFAALGLWCSYVVTQEASQVAYAVPGMVVLLLAALAGPHGRASRMRMIRAIAAGASAALGGVLVYFIFLYSRSQLSGWLAFMMTLNDSAAYSAARAPLGEWFSGHAGLNSIFLLVLVVLLMGGVLNLTCRRSLPDVYVFLPLCIGLLGWVLAQKEIMRAGVITQILPIPVIGLAILLFQVRASIANRGPDLGLGFCLAFIFGCFVMDPRIGDPVRGRLAQSTELSRNVSAALFHSADWARTTAEYFSPNHFQFGDIRADDLKQQLSSAAPVEPNDSFYVLGNNSEIYALFGKMAPYSIYLYNMSPLDLQLRTNAWMEEKHAKYVFWDYVHKDFDGIANEVRLPVLFSYVVEHYSLLSANSRYRILQRLNNGERPNLDSWFGLLGPSVDLGYIPAASALTESSQGAITAEVLVVHVPQPIEDSKATVNLTFNGHPYTISFSERKQKTTYIIRLDRVPLLAAGISTGAGLGLGENGSLAARIQRIFVPKDDLY